ncbi:MAG TPA: transglycosylase SLT domain-containing protein [Synergistaceae bacterium]|nr:transglycosylase SLT domain-containing protein [Synergistaceae bacterium]HQK25100.1 transglycosylase SLT domain-containing protein [Synergistaceae bacterium]
MRPFSLGPVLLKVLPKVLLGMVLWGGGIGGSLPGEGVLVVPEEGPPEASAPFSSEDLMEARIRQGLLFYNRRLHPAAARAYGEYAVAYGRMCRIDPFLLAGVLVVESRGDPEARSPVAHGLMQINWEVHKDLIRSRFPFIQTAEDARIPSNNLLLGAFLLRRYLDACGGREEEALYRYLGARSPRYVAAVQEARHRLASTDPLFLVRLDP